MDDMFTSRHPDDGLCGLIIRSSPDVRLSGRRGEGVVSASLMAEAGMPRNLPRLVSLHNAAPFLEEDIRLIGLTKRGRFKPLTNRILAGLVAC